MRGDFSRDTYEAIDGFRRVLLQQCRVHVDADWNEQVALLVASLQSLTADLVGPHGGPAANAGFEVALSGDQGKPPALRLGPGRYYVEGLPCDSPANGFAYDDQPWWPAAREAGLPDPPYLVYLDVWEQHLTSIEAPRIAEVALGGPDTATRTRVVYQVRAFAVDDDADEDAEQPQPQPRPPKEAEERELAERRATTTTKARAPRPAKPTARRDEQLVASFTATGSGTLRARTPRTEVDDSPCVMPPSARYRGVENQLYRVEIHRGGPAGEATFKWSRDNGAVCFPVRRLVTSTPGAGGEPVSTTAQLDHLGGDERYALQPGDWVEVCDDRTDLDGRPRPLLRVEQVDNVDLSVVLAGAPAHGAGTDLARHPFLRRWDHKAGDPEHGGLRLAEDGAAVVEQGEGGGNWLALEDGIEVQFPPADDADPRGEGPYRAGDYWLIPARTATGDIEWPLVGNEPAALPPRGVVHHYAPLARITRGSKQEVEAQDRRRTFKALAE